MSNAIADIRMDLQKRADRLASEEYTLRLTLEKLNAMGHQDAEVGAIIIPLGTTAAEAELRLFLATLAWKNFNRTATADALGISRRSVFNLLAKYLAAGPTVCVKCPAVPTVDGPAWTIPNLCPTCVTQHQEQEDHERRRHRKLSKAGAEAVVRRRGESIRVLAEEYNVSRSVIKHILAGETYRDIPRPAQAGGAAIVTRV